MPYTTITKPDLSSPTKKSLIDAVIDDLDYLKTSIDSLGGLDGSKIPNGSFETDSDNDGKPDGWVVTTPWSGGSFALVDQNAAAGNSFHGRYATKFTSTGSGGGHAVSADYFPVTPGAPVFCTWAQKGTADVKNIVQIFWYQGDTGKTPSATASTTIYTNAVTNPTDWQTLRSFAIPPSDARFAKLKFIGCDETDATAGSTYFDFVSISDIAFKNKLTLSTAGTYKFVAPITGLARVRLWAGGGDGGAGDGGGGGGGGEYVDSMVAITARTTYTIVVGARRADSTFETSVVVAKAAGDGAYTAYGPGGTGGTGVLKVSGQDGTYSYGASVGGYSHMGGTGGAFGANGFAPGGGGGGNGGQGAAGQAVIEW